MTNNEFDIILINVLFVIILWLLQPLMVRRFIRVEWQRLPFDTLRQDPKVLEQTRLDVIERQQRLKKVYRYLRIILPLYTLLTVIGVSILITFGFHGLWVYFMIFSGCLSMSLLVVLRVGRSIGEVTITRLS